MASVLKITEACLKSDYTGSGKAWAAVNPAGEVVAIRYMGNHSADSGTMPAWVVAVRDNAEGLDGKMLPTAWSSKGLSKLAEAAQACADCPKRPKGGRYRPTDLLTMARAALLAFDGASFHDHREKSRSELAALGTVISGMCSCTEFVAK